MLADTLQDAASRGDDWQQAVKRYQEEMVTYAFKVVASATSMLRRSTMRNPLVRFALLHAVPWVRSLTGVSPVVKVGKEERQTS